MATNSPSGGEKLSFILDTVFRKRGKSILPCKLSDTQYWGLGDEFGWDGGHIKDHERSAMLRQGKPVPGMFCAPQGECRPWRHLLLENLKDGLRAVSRRWWSLPSTTSSIAYTFAPHNPVG